LGIFLAKKNGADKRNSSAEPPRAKALKNDCRLLRSTS